MNLDSLRLDFDHFLQTLRWADVLDVIVVAMILFGVISWARRSASRNIVIAILAFGALYLVSRALDMYLTRVFLQAILAVVVLAVIIVFQDDLRRLLDRLGGWSLRRNQRRAAAGDSNIDTLISAAEELANARTGALIALRGAESWNRAVRGGVSLDGEVSLPLLVSIFDHHSAGHDGAVLIERGRITRFATHLPLSSNHEALGRRGTRHAAALGLSETCDAILIVISEETGSITVAERGRMDEVESGGELRERLDDFHQRHHKTERAPWREWLTRHSIQNAALACIIAVGLWFAFAHRAADQVVRTFAVPIELRGLPEGMTLEGAGGAEARITLEGPARALELLSEEELIVAVDIASITAGQHVILLTSEQLNLPRDVTLSNIDPPYLSITAKEAPPPAEGGEGAD